METREITRKEINALKPYTKRRKVRFWGSDHSVKPVLLETVFGDGKKLMWFQTMNNRPDVYIVLMDSSYTEAPNNIYDLFPDWPEPLYEVIEDEYGNVNDPYNEDKEDHSCNLYRKSTEKYPCSGCEKYLCCEFTRWPKLNCDCVCSWGIAAIMEMISAVA